MCQNIRCDVFFCVYGVGSKQGLIELMTEFSGCSEGVSSVRYKLANCQTIRCFRTYRLKCENVQLSKLAHETSILSVC